MKNTMTAVIQLLQFTFQFLKAYCKAADCVFNGKNQPYVNVHPARYILEII